jgi:3-methyladenine DNA glycosylase AlkD
LWERRISIISTFAFIREGELKDSLKIAEILLHDKEDLMHKAVGWVLREVGKHDIALLRGFLAKHATTMPRTVLRYSIEKMEESERQHYLHPDIMEYDLGITSLKKGKLIPLSKIC